MGHRKAVGISAETDGVESPKSFKGENKMSCIPLSTSKRNFLLCLVLRMVNSLLVQTYFNPDEHWQALEVAHRITFGYGHLTWEWNRGIRSYLHPMLFALLYKILAILHLDTPVFMINAPGMLQSMLSTTGDLYLYKLSQVLFGGHIAQWAVSLKALLILCERLYEPGCS